MNLGWSLKCNGGRGGTPLYLSYKKLLILILDCYSLNPLSLTATLSLVTKALGRGWIYVGFAFNQPRPGAG